MLGLMQEVGNSDVWVGGCKVFAVLKATLQKHCIPQTSELPTIC